MITELYAERHRCLKDTRVTLTPLHALIGPNDSGKSTLLDALRRLVSGVGTEPGGLLTMRTGEHAYTNDSQTWTRDGAVQKGHDRFVRELGAVRSYRLDPDRLRLKSALLHGPEVELGSRGEYLPGVYDAILNRDRDAWEQIEKGLRGAFPTVRRLALRPVSQGEKVIEVELHDGTRVGADGMSEGLLYWLAFAALPYVSPVKLVLVEEPENGLHPARIAAVVAVLRQLSESGTQVVMATHSPLVVNELRPEEVSVVTRTPEEGTKVRRVSEIPDLDRLTSVFSLGELWLSYANGIDEKGLFETKRSSA